MHGLAQKIGGRGSFAIVFTGMGALANKQTTQKGRHFTEQVVITINTVTGVQRRQLIMTLLNRSTFS